MPGVACCDRRLRVLALGSFRRNPDAPYDAKADVAGGPVRDSIRDLLTDPVEAFAPRRFDLGRINVDDHQRKAGDVEAPAPMRMSTLDLLALRLLLRRACGRRTTASRLAALGGGVSVCSVAALRLVIGGAHGAERLEHALEGDVGLIAGDPLRTVGSNLLVLVAQPVEVRILELAELERLGELTAHLLELRFELTHPRPRCVTIDRHHVELSANVPELLSQALDRVPAGDGHTAK